MEVACPSRLFNFNGSYPVTNSVQVSIMGGVDPVSPYGGKIWEPNILTLLDTQPFTPQEMSEKWYGRLCRDWRGFVEQSIITIE